MEFVADFHIHSKYSRATSRDMDLENLDKWAKIKGIKVLGTGDFTHPQWFKELKEKLEPAEAGLYRLKSEIRNPKSETAGVRFILTAEISCIYSKKNKVRKIHIIIFAPSFEAVEKINAQLGWQGNLKSDGRPILGLDAKELLKIVLSASEDCLIVPAHAWTPWFSIFGSKSGFDSIEECFDEYSKYIYAIETGLSSSPDMNWRLSPLDRIALISNSDAHSPQKIGREANVFGGEELSYSAMAAAIKKSDDLKPPYQSKLGTGQAKTCNLIYTIEFFPEEGKYHYDGHRLCNIVLSPKETKKYNGICPNCGRPLTVGVLSRVEELADRPPFDKSASFAEVGSATKAESGGKPEGAIPFKSLIPLAEIIADALGVLPGAKQVEKEYQNLIGRFGSELKILLNTPKEELEKTALPEISEGIIRVREGKVNIEPGYDGVYGKIKIFSKGEQKTPSKQKSLF